MNKSTLIIFLGAVMIVLGLTRVDASGAAGQKVGFVDLERTLMETKAGKSAKAKFERVRKSKQGKVDKEKKQLEKMAADLEKQKSILKPAAFAKKRAELEKKYLKVQETFMKLERELAGEQAKLIQGILKKAGPIIEDIAKKEGYSIILDRNAVLWANSGYDITAKVNKRIK